MISWCENFVQTAFPQNFHTRKSGETTLFFPVNCTAWSSWEKAGIFLSGLFSFFLFSQFIVQQGKGGDHPIPLYHFHPPTNIQTIICTFAGLRWLLRTINRNACNCQTVTQWYLSKMRVSTWLFIEFYVRFYVRSHYIDYSLTSGGFELTPTINLVLQAK